MDNDDEGVTFTRALGLDAILADLEDPEELGRIPDGAFDYLWVSDSSAASRRS